MFGIYPGDFRRDLLLSSALLNLLLDFGRQLKRITAETSQKGSGGGKVSLSKSTTERQLWKITTRCPSSVKDGVVTCSGTCLLLTTYVNADRSSVFCRWTRSQNIYHYIYGLIGQLIDDRSEFMY